jgi:ribosomal protein S18 acetylase RimI-like enzyme
VSVLEFDSAWFGAKIGRCDGDPVAADRWAREQKLDCLYTLLPLSQIGLIHPAVEDGFKITDVRVEFAITPYDAPLLRRVRSEDKKALREIARTAFRRTRFHNDRRFDPDRVNALYENWLLTSEGEVLVADSESGPAGFAVVGATNLELIAVAERERGEGYGDALTRSAIGIAHQHRRKDFRVVTQSGNLAAQRTFKAAGFKFADTSIWLHKWYS